MLKKQKAVVYTRVSSAEQVENHSLATQKRACEEFCERGGIEAERVFSDEGESAKTADRPQLQQLLKYCQQHAKTIDFVIVYNVSRLARQLLDHQMLRFALAKLGVQVRAVTETFDDSASGKLVENMLAVIAQFDNDQKAARTIEGMRASLAAGRWTHQPPLGYLKPAGGKAEPSLVHDPERAPLVHLAFERMATGACTKQQVLDELNAAGLRTRRGERLSAQSLTNLLRNPLYAGILRVPKWSFEGPGDFEPIVPREVFERVQDVLHGRRPTVVSRHRDHPDFPLRRFVRCDACGAPLTGSWSRGRNDRYPYYFCRSRGCGKVSVRKERLESKFRQALADLAVRPEVLALFEEVVRDVWKARHAECLDQRRRLGAQLDEVERRVDRVVDAYLHEGRIDADTYAAQRARLDREIAEVQAQLHAPLPLAQDLDAALHFASGVLADPAGCWERLDAKQKVMFQQAVYPDGLSYASGRIGTAKISWAFGYLQEEVNTETRVASPAGVEPASPP